MNTDTGRVYTGHAEIEAAMERGEPLAHLSNGIVEELFGDHPPVSGDHLPEAQRREVERAANRKFAEGYMSREARKQP